MFKRVELTKTFSSNDQAILNMWNKVRHGTVNDNTEKLLKIRFIDKSDKKYPYDAFHVNPKKCSNSI